MHMICFYCIFFQLETFLFSFGINLQYYFIYSLSMFASYRKDNFFFRYVRTSSSFDSSFKESIIFISYESYFPPVYYKIGIPFSNWKPKDSILLSIMTISLSYLFLTILKSLMALPFLV